MVINLLFKKQPLFANDIIIYKRTGKKKTLKTKRDYTKVVKYRVNTQKSVSFLYANNEQLEFEIKKTNKKNTLAPKKKKYLCTNQTEYV